MLDCIRFTFHFMHRVASSQNEYLNAKFSGRSKMFNQITGHIANDRDSNSLLMGKR